MQEASHRLSRQQALLVLWTYGLTPHACVCLLLSCSENELRRGVPAAPGGPMGGMPPMGGGPMPGNQGR
jgi:hypothetical protein